mmetsp:Transcript_8079/g.16740  ORF Transcript_8079/g.16740 Transcript_8079/m.16740 type:complete len:327 (-) Transcript_8079:94-1074(-)
MVSVRVCSFVCSFVFRCFRPTPVPRVSAPSHRPDTPFWRGRGGSGRPGPAGRSPSDRGAPASGPPRRGPPPGPPGGGATAPSGPERSWRGGARPAAPGAAPARRAASAAGGKPLRWLSRTGSGATRTSRRAGAGAGSPGGGGRVAGGHGGSGTPATGGSRRGFPRENRGSGTRRGGAAPCIVPPARNTAAGRQASGPRCCSRRRRCCGSRTRNRTIPGPFGDAVRAAPRLPAIGSGRATRSEKGHPAGSASRRAACWWETRTPTRAKQHRARSSRHSWYRWTRNRCDVRTRRQLLRWDKKHRRNRRHRHDHDHQHHCCFCPLPRRF